MQRVRARQEQPLHSRLCVNQAFPSLPNHRGSGMASTLRFHPSSGRKADERRKSMLGDSEFRSQVEALVLRAALRQGIWNAGFRAVCPLVGPRLKARIQSWLE